MNPDSFVFTERILLPFWKSRATTSRALSATELQQRYLGAVLQYVVARIRNRADAEDVTAEVFAAAFASLSRCPAAGTGDDDPIRAWLFGIARRKLADAHRRQSRRKQEAIDPETPAPAGRQPESIALANEASETLTNLIGTLPELQAEAVRLKYIDDLSLVEIGWILQRSPNAVGQLLHRARQTLRALGGDYFGTELMREERKQ